MNERAWLTATRPYRLVSHLGPDASRRKLRLLGVACCYRIRGLLTDPRSWRAVEVAERFADGLADEEQLRAAFNAAEGISPFGNEGAAGRVSAPPGQSLLITFSDARATGALLGGAVALVTGGR